MLKYTSKYFPSAGVKEGAPPLALIAAQLGWPRGELEIGGCPNLPRSQDPTLPSCPRPWAGAELEEQTPLRSGAWRTGGGLGLRCIQSTNTDQAPTVRSAASEPGGTPKGA